MKKKRKKQKDSKSFNKIITAIAVILLITSGGVYYAFFSSMTGKPDTHYIYIDDDDTQDSVYAKLKPIATGRSISAFRMLAGYSGYGKNIRSGRYAIKPNDGTLTVFRRMKNGMQTPVNLTIPSVRTMDRLASVVSQKLMMDSATIYRMLTDSSVCRKYGYDTKTIACLFIPNTYDVYWNISPEKFMERMQKENKRFWNFERTEKAKNMGLTPEEVVTMASIVDEETANDAEKPMIAGMYYNRLNTGMPLQADPTVKFAIGDFSIKRIYNNMLKTDSPYNTYKNTGLPPGPIRIPSVAGIDAVLDHIHHEYLYMCAKEDFSGTHNFARTYEEHLANAAKYSKALNQRGIK